MSKGTVGAATPTCFKCGQKFSRRQHLQRHRSGCETGKRSFVCQICRKAFTRKDVMDRHVRAMHGMKESGKVSRRKSCLQCVQLKIKCTGGFPLCEGCQKRNTSCCYPQDFIHPCVEVPMRPVGTSFPVSEKPVFGEQSDSQHGSNTRITGLNGDYSNECPREGTNEVLPMPYFGEQSQVGCVSPSRLYDEVLPDNLLSDANYLNGSSLTPDWLHSLLFESASAFPNSLIEDPMLLENVPLPIAEPLSSKDSWIRAWQPDEDPNQITNSLPQLSLQIDFPAAQMPLCEQTRQNIVKILKAPMIKKGYQSVDIHTLPSKDVLGHCLALFFKHFDPIHPIFHQSTFDPDHTPEVLLAVLIGIGSAYSSVAGAEHFSNTMVELSVGTLTWMGDLDSRYRRTMFYVIALVLVSYYTLGAGNKKLLEESESLRSHLIVNARYMGLFNPQIWVDDDDLQTCWLKWRDEELRKRVAWSIFALDSSVSIFLGVRPCMSLVDVKNNLPCQEALWRASTAHTWAATVPWTGRSPRGLPFLSTFQELVAEKLPLNRLLPYSKRICAQALQRLIMDMKELESNPMSKVIALSFDTQVAFGGAIIKTLRSLLASVSDTDDFAEHVNYCTVVVIAHYTCLWAPGRALEQVASLVRADKHERRILAVNFQKDFAERPAESRRLAWHAAQIVTLHRHRAMFSPGDPIRVFMAGCFLYMFTRHAEHDKNQNSFPVKLDSLSWLDKVVPTEWISKGGPAMFENTHMCPANSRAVLESILATLHHLRQWGLCRRFHQILIQVADDDDSNDIEANLG